MKDKQNIIRLIRGSKTVRAIYRETGFHRKTIRKYINIYNEKEAEHLISGISSQEERIS